MALASAQKIPWAGFLTAITIISVVISWWLLRNKSYETNGIKFLVAGVYFWVITFAQLIVLAMVWQAL